MSALTLPSHHARIHLSLRVAVPTLAVALTAVAGAVLVNLWSDDGASVTVADDVSPTVVIGRWLEEARDDLFPVADGPFLGECPHDAPGLTVGLCSRLIEDLGAVQIHLVGVYATDWGADVLLERGADGWTVIDESPWPELGSPSFGPPWSPTTAIAAWWSRDAAPSATERFGEHAVHLRSCAEAREVADAPTGQPLLCSSLVESRMTGDGARQRAYLSGRVDAPPAARIAVTEQPDHTWLVTDVVELAGP